MSSPKTRPRIETLAVHAGERRPGPEGSVVYPIFQGTVYAVPPGTDYHDIPLHPPEQHALAALPARQARGAGGGARPPSPPHRAWRRSRRSLHTLMSHGDHLLAGDCLYGGTHDFLTQDTAEARLERTPSSTPQRPETWDAAVHAEDAGLPARDDHQSPDARAAAARGRPRSRARAGLTTVIDNTFASPVNFRPLEHGFDLVLPQRHEVPQRPLGPRRRRACSARTPLVERVRRTLNHYGGSLDPHAGFLLARGIKTLALRVRAQNANALGARARSCASTPKVRRGALSRPARPPRPRARAPSCSTASAAC